MKNYGSNAKDKFIAGLPTKSLESPDDEITSLCKFNFAYFDASSPGQNFSDWNHAQLNQLLEKLNAYSKHSLSHWISQRGGRIFTIYGDYPSKSDFRRPRHVPHEAQWARFRLESAIRLIGFVIPRALDGKVHTKTNCAYDSNTFYVVFLDAKHLFYKTEKK
jgi:hypothetical protein